MSDRRDDRFWCLKPPAWLAGDVHAMLGRRACVARGGFDVMPSAQPEILFHFADPFLVGPLGGAARDPLPRAALLGPRFERYRQSAGPRIDWFIIQLTPTGCHRYLGTPFTALVDTHVALRDFAGASVDNLWEQLRAAASFAERATLALSWLQRRDPVRGGDAAISRLAWHARTGPAPSVAALARDLDQSPRRLHQRFVSELGTAPKHWLSLMRVNRYLQNLHPRTQDLAFEYADESHASREFKRFSGLTPGDYRRIKAGGDPLVNTGSFSAE